MDDEIAKVREMLLTLRPSYTTTNKEEVRVRCPYCGDSKHDMSSAHLYIAMRPPFKFHCFKCETSGVLNMNVLRDLGIFDNDVNMSIVSANKSYKENSGVQKLSFKRNNLNVIPYDSEISKACCDYFNNRYGSNYDNATITQKFKAVTDAPAFFKDNGILIKQNVFDFSKAIGFLSSDSTHIIFRDITNTQPNRYYNLNISQDNGSMISKMYNINGDIDVMHPKFKLVITEGIFDIIGVYHHFHDNYDENTIFAAACGKAYNAVILNYIHKGFLSLNIEIFSDADVPIEFYKSLKASSPYLSDSQIVIYYNGLYQPGTKISKDFGCKREEIELRKYLI